MNTIQVLGLTLAVNNDGTLQMQPVANVSGSLSGTFDGHRKASLRASLAIGQAAKLDLQLDLSLTENATGDWIPDAGNQPQGGSALLTLRDSASPTSGVLALQFGPLQFVANEFAPTTIRGDGVDNVLIHFPPDDTLLTSGANMPVFISCGDAGFSINLSGIHGGPPTVNLQAGFCKATCLTTMDGLDDQGQSAPNDYFSLTMDSDLSPPYALTVVPDTIEISFPIQAGQKLYLHTDVLARTADTSNASKDNPIFAALSAESFALHATLGRTATFPQFRQIQLRPLPPTPAGPGASQHAASPVLLTAYNYADSMNTPLKVSVDGNVDLHLRVGTSGRPTSFLVAPNYSRPARTSPARSAALGVTMTNKEHDGTLAQIHGLVALHQFRPAESGSLVSELNWAVPVDPSLIPENAAVDIVSEHTTPWLYFAGQTDADGHADVAMRHAKPGTTFRPPGNSTSILPYNFTGQHLALPLLPKEGFQSAPDLLNAHYKDLNNTFYSGDDKYSYDLQQSVHETLLTEKPLMNGNTIDSRSTVHISTLFDASMVLPAKEDPNYSQAASIKLNDVTLTRGYGPVTIQMTVPADAIPDYVVLRANDPSIRIEPANLTFPLDSGGIGTCDGSPQKGLQGIVKLSSRYSLDDIFTNANLGQDLGADFLTMYVDSTVLEPGWIGLILFSVPIDFLGQLIPKGSLNVQYLAITPQKGQSPISVNAHLQWSNTDHSSPPMTGDDEARFQMESVDAVWYDSELIALHASGTLRVGSFFGVPFDPSSKTGDGREIPISGSINLADHTIRFVGTLPQPIGLLPTSLTFGPVAQVWAKSVDVVLNPHDNTSTFLLSGSVDFRAIDHFTLSDDDTTVQFQGLGIHFGTPTTLAPQWASISYPSFDFKFNSSPFRLGFLELQPQSFGVDFSGDGSGFPWSSLVTVTGNDQVKPVFRCDLSLELMALPELAEVSADRLVLDFTIGLGLNASKSWDSSTLIIKLKAVTFDNLHLQLLRFLEFDCNQASFGIQDGVTSLKFDDVTLRVLGATFVRGLSLFIYSSQAGNGFFGYLPTDTADIGVYWVIVGHNVSMKSVAQRLMSADAPTTDADNLQIRKDISTAVSNNEFLPGTDPINGGGWVFAAGLSFFGLVQCKFLFADHAYYGLCLRGGVLSKWFGDDFDTAAISVLYVKGDRPEQDSFITSVRVPMMVTETFAFLGGVISIEVVMNGGFTLDVGFPWLGSDGSRSWDRAFGAIVTPYQAQGGFYMRWYFLSAPVGNAKGLLLASGYAIEAGLGGAYGDKVFTVWAKIGLYSVLEGQVYFESGELRGIQYSGAEGILGQAAAELNWWIISLRVYVTISAEVGYSLQWGRLAPGLPDPPPQAVVIQADFTVYVSAAAQACIGVGFISICKDISVTLPLRFSYQFQLKA